LAGLKETQTKAVNLAIEKINAAGGGAGKKLEAVFITYPGTPDTAVDVRTRAPSRRMARCSSRNGHLVGVARAAGETSAIEGPDARSDGQCRRPDRQGLLAELFPGQCERSR
jgi:hypothetical protein